MGRWWALGAALCLLIGGLVACGGAAPATAPYVGARLHGYPVPGAYRVVSDDGTGLYLVAEGDKATIPDTYAAAWRADGWQVARRDPSADGVAFTFTRPGVARLVLFAAYSAGADNGMMVFIPTP